MHMHDPKPALATHLIKVHYLWNTLSHLCKVIKILLAVLYWVIMQPGFLFFFFNITSEGLWFFSFFLSLLLR